MTVHDFKTQLAWSETASDEPFWRAVYTKAFPDMVNCMPCPGDVASQRMGIDRLIALANGKVLAVDEKKRRQFRPDIALEFLSNDRTGAPGWIEKSLAIDYLAYAFMDVKKCYLLSWPMLRRAWHANKAEWLKHRFIATAPNRGYNTLSVVIPAKELYKALTVAAIIQL